MHFKILFHSTKNVSIVVENRLGTSKYQFILKILNRLLLREEDAHDVTKALGVFRDLEFRLGIVSRFLLYCFASCVSSTRSKSL